MDQGQRQAPVPSWWWPNLHILKQVVRRALHDDISATATQLAFHITCSFFPMLLVLTFILSSIEAPFLFTRIMVMLQSVLPPEVITLIDRVLDEVEAGTSWGVFLTGLSLALWWSVSGLHVLILAINRAYGVRNYRSYWKRTVVAIGLTVILTVLLVLATALTISGQWLGERLARWMGLDDWFVLAWVLLRWPAIVMAVVGGLVILYTIGPNLPLPARHVLPGAVVGGSLWVIATSLFALYIRNFAAYNRVYGSIGGMIVLMLWMYVGAFVILLGAELNGTLYRRQYGPTPGDTPQCAETSR